MGWWIGRLRYYGSAFRFYPLSVRTFVRWELGSRALFFLTALCALAVMPAEYKLATAALVVARYAVVAVQVRRIARRKGLCLRNGRHGAVYLGRALHVLRPLRPLFGGNRHRDGP